MAAGVAYRLGPWSTSMAAPISRDADRSGAALLPAGSATQGPPSDRTQRTETPAPVGNVQVVVYTTRWCPVCKRAKKWMASSGVQYEERDVESSPSDGQRMRALNPRGSVPTFDIDGQVLVGFSPEGLIAAMRRAAAIRAARQTL